MSSQSCSELRPRAFCGLLAAVVAALACNEAEPTVSAPKITPAPPLGPATLVVELPAGVEVSIDGAKRRAAPIEGLEVEPGEHTLTLVTACQEVELRVAALPGRTTRVDPERAEGLRLTTLEVATRDLDGKALAHTVALDGRVVASGEGSSKVTVPSCKHRMKVASEGLGGFIEDIEFGEEAVVREIVLAPGPDMVRIHGGPFTLGPPESSSRMAVRWDRSFPRKDVVFATFDMDETELTAAQFHACRASGRCAWDWGRDIGLEKWPRFPPDYEQWLCTTALDFRERKPVSGRENHPMNCVSYHEAEMYCTAVGKRLPTAAEWEYASRSRKSDYYCPWAPPEDVSAESPACGRVRALERGTHEVCLHPDHNTEQGLCDMPWNVTEIVSEDHMNGPGVPKEAVTTRGGWYEHFFDGDTLMFVKHSPRGGDHLEPTEQDFRMGFRCVRDVGPRTVEGSEE